jgi:hypothetical protein
MLAKLPGQPRETIGEIDFHSVLLVFTLNSSSP